MSAVAKRVERSGVQMYLEVAGEEGSVLMDSTMGLNPTASPRFDSIEDLSARVQNLANRIKDNKKIFVEIRKKYLSVNPYWENAQKIVNYGAAVYHEDGYSHSDFALGRRSAQCVVVLSELNRLVQIQVAQQDDKKAARTDFYKWIQKNPGFRDDQDLLRKVDSIAALLQVTDCEIVDGTDRFPAIISQLKEAIVEGIPRDELEMLGEVGQNKEEVETPVEKQSCCVIC